LADRAPVPCAIGRALWHAVNVLPALVLAAGEGTRLRPLTDWRAKSLVPIGDRPALAHVLDRLGAAGAAPIAVNAHHHASAVAAFARARGAGVSHERELLGTAGGLAHAAGLLGSGDVIVWNADVFADVDLRGLVAAHGLGGAAATLVVRPRAIGLGPVGVDAGGRVVRLRAERFGDEAQGGDYVGVSVVGARLRARLPERGCLVGDAWIPALFAGETIRAFVHDAAWHDIGSVASYLAANLAWLDARGFARWVGEGARVAPGVSTDRTILGARAHALGAGTLARCVVWPGASVTAPLSDAVVADGSAVVRASQP
jgi:mannose-1-phosphate guanylyltransferase